MTHERADELLLELAFGDLPPREARAVEAHVAECAECREELDRIRGTRSLMALLPAEPPPERGEAILFAAAREVAEARAPRPRSLVPRWLWAGGLGAVAAVAVAVVSWQLVRIPAGGPARSREDALMGRAAPRPAPASAAPASPAAPAEAKAEPAAVEKAGAGNAVAEKAAEPAGGAVARQHSDEQVADGFESPAKRKGDAAVALAPSQSAAPAPRKAEVPGPGPAAALGAVPPAPAPAAGAARGWVAAERDEAAAPAVAKAARRPSEAYEGGAGALDAIEAPAAARSAAPAPVPAPSPAPPPARARAAERKAVAAPAAAAPGAATADAAPAPVRGPGTTETRDFPACPGERRRVVERDADGRVVRYVRFLADARRVEQSYGPDGRLLRAGIVDGKVLRLLPLETPWLVRDARDAGIDAPPRCALP